MWTQICKRLIVAGRYGQEVAALRAQLKKPLQGQGSAAQASSSGTAGAALCDPSTEDIAAAEQVGALSHLP